MMTKSRVASLAALALALAGAGCATSEPQRTAAVTGPDACAAITAAAFGGTAASSKWIAANAESGLPAFCEVTGVLSPVASSQIGVVYRLPEGWNGKLLGLGGGGWAGNVTLQAASEGLRKGYATAQTDGGHPSTEVWNNSWAANPEARKDFAYRAIHEMTVGGKKAVDAYYGQRHDRAYYQGCSTGGRMGLMEAQRFPDDYDAIIAGAPVYSLQTQTTAAIRRTLFTRPGAAFSPGDLELVNKAVLAQCDTSDGFKDGLINDPRSCGWDPAALQCSGAKTASCLSSGQVGALRELYQGVRAPDGSWASLPMSRGGETGWGFFVPIGGEAVSAANTGGLFTLEPYVFGTQGVDWNAFTPADAQRARTSAFAKEYEPPDANLGRFFRSGGRLLLWHGESDPGPSPVGANDYAQRVTRANSAASSRFRHFLLPGTGHCGGGAGAFQVDWLEAMDQWVSTGTPPETLTGKRPDGPMVRKHCAWPKVAHYGGSGDANDPASWTCVSQS
jgi:feruloyl esterase